MKNTKRWIKGICFIGPFYFKRNHSCPVKKLRLRNYGTNDRLVAADSDNVLKIKLKDLS